MVELINHCLEVSFLKCGLGEVPGDKVLSGCKQLIQAEYMLEMVAYNLLLGREDWQVIANEIVDISVIQLAIVKDFRLVLLVSSTIECPKLIFGKLNLLFWTMI